MAIKTCHVKERNKEDKRESPHKKKNERRK
jgi:hypothetical protein